MNLVAKLLPVFPLNDKKSPWFVDFKTDNEWASESFNHGNRVLNWHALEGSCPEGPDRSLDFMLSLNGWPLFSRKFREVLEAHFPDSAQFLPVSFRSSVFENNDTSIGQILHLIDAVDRRRTKVDNNDWTPRPNGTFRVQYPIHLRLEIASKYPIFRVPETPVGIYVRNDLCELITKNQLSGVRFDFNVPLH